MVVGERNICVVLCDSLGLLELIVEVGDLV